MNVVGIDNMPSYISTDDILDFIRVEYNKYYYDNDFDDYVIAAINSFSLSDAYFVVSLNKYIKRTIDGEFNYTIDMSVYKSWIRDRRLNIIMDED